MRGMNRFVVGSIAVFTLGLAHGAPARAATICSYSNGVMTVTNTSYEMLSIRTTAYLGGPPLLSVVTGGWYQGPPAQTVPCGGPGINDVTRIDVSTVAGTSITIDQRGGALRHSGFPLGDGQRIKVYAGSTYSPSYSTSLVVYGTDGNDTIVAGTSTPTILPQVGHSSTSMRTGTPTWSSSTRTSSSCPSTEPGATT
jgi:hypothetical protein